ncbi:MAG: cupin domain-containing protein [Deltaproteobacteria bacterium]
MENKSYWVLGHHVFITHESAEYTLCDIFVPGPIPPPPPHLHKGCSVMFYLLDGHLEVKIGDEARVLKLGETLCVPAGALHSFSNPMIKPARFIQVFSPGGFEKFFRAFGIAGNTEESYEASKGDEMVKRIIAEAGKYGMEMPENS